MGIRFHEYRKKPWVVTWRNPWTGKKHTNAFCSESEATAFATAQTELAAREKAMLRKTRRKKQQHGRIRVSELLETYFLNAQTNPLTKRQAQYHASHILAAFGKRVSADLERQDILNFFQAQQERGIAPTTIYRRVSILRAALNWAAQNGLLRENPLRDLRLTRAKSRRIDKDGHHGLITVRFQSNTCMGTHRFRPLHTPGIRAHWQRQTLDFHMNQLVVLGDLIRIVLREPFLEYTLGRAGYEKESRWIICFCNSMSAVTVRQSVMNAAMSACISRTGTAPACSAR